MKKLILVLALGLFLAGCALDGKGLTSIPGKFWRDANIPCEGGDLYNYRGSTCEAPDVGSE